MKGLKSFFFGLFVILVMLLSACRMSPTELSRNVQSDIVYHFKAIGETLNVKKNLVLTREKGNNYAGTITFTVGDDTTSRHFDVIVIYDGNQYIEWKLRETQTTEE